MHPNHELHGGILINTSSQFSETFRKRLPSWWAIPFDSDPFPVLSNTCSLLNIWFKTLSDAIRCGVFAFFRSVIGFVSFIFSLSWSSALKWEYLPESQILQYAKWCSISNAEFWWFKRDRLRSSNSSPRLFDLCNIQCTSQITARIEINKQMPKITYKMNAFFISIPWQFKRFVESQQRSRSTSETTAEIAVGQIEF